MIFLTEVFKTARKVVDLSKELCQENDEKLRRMEEGILQSQESQKMFLDDLELSGKSKSLKIFESIQIFKGDESDQSLDPPIESETLESIGNLEPETAEENSQDFLADEPTEFPSTLDDLDLSESDPDDEAPSKAWIKNLVHNFKFFIFIFPLYYHDLVLA